MRILSNRICRKRLRPTVFSLLVLRTQRKLNCCTQDELEPAPKYVQELIKSMKNEFTEFLAISDEAVELATERLRIKKCK